MRLINKQIIKYLKNISYRCFLLAITINLYQTLATKDQAPNNFTLP